MLSCRCSRVRPGANRGVRGPVGLMYRPERFDGLGLWRGFGIEVPIATTLTSRLLGLAWLEWEHAGAGLLLPGCHSIHTFGMRFKLDLALLDARGRSLRTIRGVPPRRVVGHRAADAVLEIVPSHSAGRAGGRAGTA